ncbi:hypothetical protein M8818_005000 [Zalaria obscura]|uniref:Uncharacterized protein n=1 Tax=Zalaria obscura TaxID=2024903 RepID=A0ACC3SAK0_9PEZI
MAGDAPRTGSGRANSEVLPSPEILDHLRPILTHVAVRSNCSTPFPRVVTQGVTDNRITLDYQSQALGARGPDRVWLNKKRR